MEKKIIIQANPDIELHFRRNQLEYFLTFPDQAIDEETGLIFYIPGWGQRADDEYSKLKLRPYLANKYNCIVCGVNYCGIKLRHRRPGEFDYAMLDQNQFLSGLGIFYGINANQCIENGQVSLPLIASKLKEKGVKRVGRDFRFGVNLKPGTIEYESFGLMPALDHLTVLHDILENNVINKKRIVAFGTSYGGYIALLLSKFAPRTFSAIIDNSGFTEARPGEMASGESYAVHGHVPINGVEFPYTFKSPWTLSSSAGANQITLNHLMIRSMLVKDHLYDDLPNYYISHSTEDGLSPVHRKDEMVNLLRSKSAFVHYKRVDESSVDGRIFKNLNHGMGASLRGIFDLAYANSPDQLTKQSLTTDFDLNTEYIFPCETHAYKVSYSKAGIELQIGQEIIYRGKSSPPID